MNQNSNNYFFSLSFNKSSKVGNKANKFKSLHSNANRCLSTQNLIACNPTKYSCTFLYNSFAGAGKSSIMVALFRMVELSGGSIIIDGIDVSQLGIHDLRSSLAIIPQDPVLFQGTIRTNLDPFHEYDDLHLWESLRRAHLVEGDLPTATPSESQEKMMSRFTLDQSVDDEGLNFSLGQRQLLAMARALVRKARIIVMDEATSSVDFETDTKIQDTIKREFKDATLLTIAHRLRSIINYDRIVVMNEGMAAEFDTPLHLFDNEEGIFSSLCHRSGITREDIVNAQARG